MYFLQFINLIKKNKILLILLAVAAAFLAFLYNSLTPPAYEDRFNFVIKKINRLPSEDYQYDDFYALQAINMVADTVNTWLNSKSILENLDPLKNIEFQSIKLASQNIEITLRGKNKQNILNTEKKIKIFLQENIENLMLNSEKEPCFSADFLSSSLAEQKIKNWQAVIAGLLTGLLVGIGYLISKEGIKK